MIIREHELAGIRCRHCGAISPGPESTCLTREVPDVARDVGRRGFAADDADTISARLSELRAEREAALNEPAALAS